MADRSRNNNQNLNYSENKYREIIGLVYLIFAIFLGVAYYIPAVNSGILGQFFLNIGKGLIGPVAYVLPIIFVVLAVATFLEDFFAANKIKLTNLLTLTILLSSLIHVITVDADVIANLSIDSENNQTVLQSLRILWTASQDPSIYPDLLNTLPGGIVGGSIALGLTQIVGSVGTIIILSATIIIEAIILGNFSISRILLTIVSIFYAIGDWFKSLLNTSEDQSKRVDEAKTTRPMKRTQVKIEDTNRYSSSEPEPANSAPTYTINGLEQEDTFNSRRSSFVEINDNYEDDFPSETSRNNSTEAITPNFLLDTSVAPEPSSSRANNRAVEAQKLKNKNFFEIDAEEDYINNFADDDKDFSNEFLLDDNGVITAQETTPVKPVKPLSSSTSEIRSSNNDKPAARKSLADTKQISLSDAAKQAKSDPVLAKQDAKPHKEYVFPPISLLEPRPVVQKGSTANAIQEQAMRLESTLKSFGVDAKVINITTGPSITRFELRPGPGVKISKIVGLSDDIALSLAATTVRIEAPIPGKSAIGIEIPNKQTAIVGLRSLLEDKEYKNSDNKLDVPLGRDIPGQLITCNLQKMPHLLIAGATGSGKSIAINGILISLMYRCSPEDLRLLLIDPKVVELSIYNGIPHLLAPVVTDPAKAANTLNWLVQEMEQRYKLFADKKARDMAGYNELMEKEGGEKLPYIVLVIDELSDLMMTSPKEVEDSISRLTAMARAAGIHLIIATQRPSVDVITGVIKANIPSRLAFAVSSQVDSRTILDGSGAEKLLGKGDLLFFPQSASKPTRGQGAFVDDHEVAKVISYLKAQGLESYDQEVAKEIVATTPTASLDDEDEEDELFMDAVDLVVENAYASVSLLQRRLNIGYPRAGRIIDAMEAKGYIGMHAGSKPRDVKISAEEWALIKADAWNDDNI